MASAARPKRRAKAAAAGTVAVPGTSAAAAAVRVPVAATPPVAPRPAAPPPVAVVPPAAVAAVARGPVAAPPPAAPRPAVAPVGTKNSLISYDQLAGYIGDDDYFVNVRCNIGGPSTFGYMIKIIRKDKSENSKMAYFHWHEEWNGEITSAHFKVGNKKTDGQGADLDGQEKNTLTAGLARIAGKSKSAAWTDLKSLAL
jgi:hypothetical protein